MRKNIAAFTKQQYNYPDYISINQEESGDVSISIRTNEGRENIKLVLSLDNLYELTDQILKFKGHKDNTELLELLSSAYQIAEREGKDTSWVRFKNCIEKELTLHGRRPITARIFRLLPGLDNV